MSVVPLIYSGAGRTVVQTADEFVEANGIEGSVILLANADPEQCNNDDAANISYDLRVGAEFRDHRDTGKRELRSGEIIKMLPGTTVIVETEEEVWFPKSRFGMIVPKVSLLQEGLSNTTSKVDPGYRGHLLITLFNLGKSTVTLYPGRTICTMFVLSVRDGVRPYKKKPKRLEGMPTRRRWDRIRYRLEANSGFFLAVSIVWTILLTTATIILTVVQIKNSHPAAAAPPEATTGSPR